MSHLWLCYTIMSCHGPLNICKALWTQACIKVRVCRLAGEQEPVCCKLCYRP